MSSASQVRFIQVIQPIVNLDCVKMKFILKAWEWNPISVISWLWHGVNGYS